MIEAAVCAGSGALDVGISMNVARLAAALAALVFIGHWQTAAAQSGPAYHLWCRGGGGMVVNVGSEMTPAGVISKPFIQVGFTPSSHPATAATPPGPGECSWPDRVFRANEPHFFKFSATTFAAYVELRADQLNTPGLGASASDPVSANSANRIWDAILIHPSDLHIEVVNNGHGELEVTRVYF